MKKNKGIIIIVIIAIIIILLAGGYLMKEYFVRAQAEDAYEEIQEEITSLGSIIFEDAEKNDFSYVLVDGEIPIDFESLHEINTDLIAWIKVPNTNIDYPVACYSGEDQNFYLDHNMYKESQFAGCIFMQDVNETDFSEYNTVLYGHNMRNGSMFADLHKFGDKDFFAENRYIYIYMPDKVHIYEIFAAYTTNDININALYNFGSKNDYTQYINDIYNGLALNGILSDEVLATGEEKMITLSTCSSEEEDRYIVQGILVGIVEK